MAKRITVLLSGRGSNLEALLAALREGTLGGTITRVISNRPEAPGVAMARAHGVATTVVDHREFADAGGVRLGTWRSHRRRAARSRRAGGIHARARRRLVRRYAGRLINVHPSLLPLYPGLHTHRRALEEGARIHGCTVHFVTPEVDVGPIIAQAAVPVHDDDDEDQPRRAGPGTGTSAAAGRGPLVLRRTASSSPAAGCALMVCPMPRNLRRCARLQRDDRRTTRRQDRCPTLPP